MFFFLFSFERLLHLWNELCLTSLARSTITCLLTHSLAYLFMAIVYADAAIKNILLMHFFVPTLTSPEWDYYCAFGCRAPLTSTSASAEFEP